MRVIKKIKVLLVFIIMLLTFNVGVFSASEVEISDGSIYLCDDSEIYIQEDFSGTKLPQGDEKITWSYGGTNELKDGAFSGIWKGFAKATFANSIKYSADTDASNKYVLNFDVNRTNETAGFVYPLQINGIKTVNSGLAADGKTYSIGLGNKSASGIPVNSWCHVEIELLLATASITADMTVYDSIGKELVTVTDYSINTASIDNMIFTYSFVDKLEFLVDNINFYKYKSLYYDSSIKEADISVLPPKISDSTDLLNENFDTFPESIYTSSYTGNDATVWTFSGSGVYSESKVLSSGRRVLKLSGDKSMCASAALVNAIEYKSPENADNKYVLFYGMKLLPKNLSATQSLLKIKNKSGVEYAILDITTDGSLKSSDGKSELFLEEKWYSIAVVCDIKPSAINVKCVFSDGETVTGFLPIVLSEVNDISQIVFNAPGSSVVYIDNLVLYNAVTQPSQKPEARDLSVSGVCYNGRTLTGDYTYWEANLEQQGDTEYYWVRSDTLENPVYTKIKDTDQSLTYTLQSEDIGKYVSFAVVPKKIAGYDEPVGEVTYKCADSIIKEEPAKLDLDTLILTNLGTDNLLGVKEDLILLTKGDNGSKIEWISSDTSVINVDGTVERQSADVDVTLTAKVTSHDNVVTLTHEFQATVLKKEIIVVVPGVTIGGGSIGGGSGGSSVKNPGVSMSKDFYLEDTNKPIERPVYRYNDVSENHWAMDYIQELYYREIARGTEDNNFEPERNVTREEFTKMVVIAFELVDDDAIVEFEDVDKEAWYYRYVSSAYKNLIIDGIGDNKFGTGSFITRQDMSLIAYKAVMMKGLKLKENDTSSYFTDADEISDYAKKAVYTMKQGGIINGSGNNEFRPKDYATRAEVAKIIVTLLNCVNE